jgi:hypothetical protein
VLTRGGDLKTDWILALTLTAGVWATGCNDDDDDGGDTDHEHTDDTDTVPCPTTGTSGERIACIVALEGDVTAGATFYDFNCESCHCDSGMGSCGPSYPPPANLTTSFLTEENVVAVVLAGVENTDMDSYAPFPNQDLANVTTYVMETFINP